MWVFVRVIQKMNFLYIWYMRGSFRYEYIYFLKECEYIKYIKNKILIEPLIRNKINFLK